MTAIIQLGNDAVHVPVKGVVGKDGNGNDIEGITGHKLAPELGSSVTTVHLPDDEVNKFLSKPDDVDEPTTIYLFTHDLLDDWQHARKHLATVFGHHSPNQPSWAACDVKAVEEAVANFFKCRRGNPTTPPIQDNLPEPVAVDSNDEVDNAVS